MQPVWHLYDWHYFLYENQIIKKELPNKNMYVDLKNINVISFSDSKELPKKDIDNFVNLVRNNYFTNKDNKDNKYLPLKENIIPYLQCCNNKSFITFFYENEYDNKENNNGINSIEISKKIIGGMTSKVLYIWNLKLKQTLPVYYVDYLTIDKQFRKKGYAEKIIQTHEYVQRHDNKKIQVSLFKREGDITGIVPLVIYKTYGFDMKNWKIIEKIAKNKIRNIIDVTESNINILRYFFEISKNLFDIFICPDYSNILELIKTKNIFISAYVFNNEVECLYIFKKTCTYIGKKSEFISLIASIKREKITNNEFIDIFKLSLEKILLSNSKIPFTHLLVEDTSHNNIIINNLRKKTSPIINSPTAFFLYNYISPTISNNKIFITL